MRRLISRIITILIASAILSACNSRGPAHIVQDRFEYGTFLADSRKNQGLVNIVRQRYLDWPVFMEIQQVLTSYKWEIQPAVKAEIKQPQLGSSHELTGLISAKYSENPTVLYKPLGGADYSRAMLSPARPGVVFALIKTGFPADRIFSTLIHSINSFNNEFLEQEQAHAATAEFREFSELLRELQLSNAISINVRKAGRNSERVWLTVKTQRMNPAMKKRWNAMKDVLDLESADNVFEVVFGSSSRQPDVVAIRTRSVIQVMNTLSIHVEVPDAHLKANLAPTLQKLGYDKNYQPMLVINSGDQAPEDAFVSISYKGYDFWIADTQTRSKQTFLFLSLLLTITESGEGGGGQIVIPAG